MKLRVGGFSMHGFKNVYICFNGIEMVREFIFSWLSLVLNFSNLYHQFSNHKYFKKLENSKTNLIITNMLCHHHSFIHKLFQNIGDISLRSKYFSSEATKPISVQMRDVKINQTSIEDTEDFYTSKKNEKLKPVDFNQNFKKVLKKMTDFVVELLPPTVMRLVQVSISLHNKLIYNKPKKN